ncbi:MAG: T9SS type A sorting domain-containing protein [Cytophagaceae bacterium]|jgi:hypothetical protein|nr:T9SS type A sorting domain-containing protein [Cytophagaceae bacterium]
MSSKLMMGQCTTTPQVNSVINGDFESGFIPSGPGSFSSDQIYVYDATNSATSALMDAVLADPWGNHTCAWASDGYYHIASYFGQFRCSNTGFTYDGHPFLTEMDGRYDHTQGIGGTGKYLMIDSKNGPATGLGIILWEQDIAVVPNSQYYFSGWFINLSPVSNGSQRVQLRFVVEYFNSSNVSLGVFQLGSQFSPNDASRGNNWEQAYVTTVSPAGAASAKIGIYNQTANVINGNDVGIDDISFSNGCQAVAGATNPPTPNLGPDVSICTVNTNLTLHSGVSTNPPTREFSWFSVSGGVETPIILNSVSANTRTISAPGVYRVCVYEPTGCAKSDYITVFATNNIVLSPDNQNLCDPNASSFTMSSTLASPGASYSYSWQRNGSPIAGTGSSRTITQAGTYTITATHPNRASCNASDNALVLVNPATTSIGSDVNICANTSSNFQHAFTSSVTGSAYSYQWQKDGTNISGATNSAYTAIEPGTYRINLTHPIAGCSIFDEVVVSNTTIMTTNIGADVNLCTNNTPSFTSSLTHPSFQYQWLLNGVAIAGATTSSYAPRIAGTYRLNITQATAGCSFFDEAIISNSNAVTANNANFCAPPAIPVNLSVSGTGPFNWFTAATGGTQVATNSSTYTTPAISATTSYFVQATATSNASMLPGSAFGVPDNYPTYASDDDANAEGITFTTLRPNVVLNSVNVYVQEWASATNLQLDVINTNTNAVVGSSSLIAGPIPATSTASPHTVTIPINVTIPAMGDYKLVFRMGFSVSGPLRFESSGFTGTDATNTIQITGSADEPRNYFRNLSFTYPNNPCLRIPVTALSTGSCTLPVDQEEIKEGGYGEELEEMEASIYPNPVHHSFQLQLEQGVSEAHFKIMNVNGSTVLQGNAQHYSSIDIHHLPKSVYYLEIRSESKLYISKLLKD